MALPDRLVLLFLHGGGFNKETWAPVIRRVQDTPLLKSVPCEIHSIDWPFHGARNDDSTTAMIWFDGPKKNWPRVDHPAKNWPHWAPEELHKHVQSIREQDQDELSSRTRIVVVAHSMGATAAMLVEMRYPGTFDGLVAFEPICNGNMAPEVCVVAANVMVANTLAREGEWSSWDDVLTHFRTTKLYRKWHPEATESYLKGAVCESSPQLRGDATMAFRLAMPPIQEAALYCYDIKAVTFAMEDYARMQCRVIFEYGEKTTLFRHDIMADVADVFPTKFTVSRPIQGAAHLMILEDPDACAERIVADLATFPVFQKAALRNGSKL